MIAFETLLQKFSQKGEKSGWTFVEISPEQAFALKPNFKQIFKVKGSIDAHQFFDVSVFPMGDGTFILPVNASMRKAIGKKVGALVQLQLIADEQVYALDADFMECLADDENASKHFNSLPPSHQRYFSKWIASAKTNDTKTKRIMQALQSLAAKMSYPEMIRANKLK